MWKPPKNTSRVYSIRVVSEELSSVETEREMQNKKNYKKVSEELSSVETHSKNLLIILMIV